VKTILGKTMALLWLSALIPPAGTGAQARLAEDVRLFSDYAGPYKVLERSDLSRYDNGRYTGHVYREVRALINPEPSAAGKVYQGNFFILEETLRDMQRSARAVDDVIPVRFELFYDGRIKIDDDRGFPAMRGFPAFPAERVQPGDRWTAAGERAADPLNTGAYVRFPIIAEYIYRGQELYKEIPVYHITAKYAVRFTAAKSQLQPRDSFTGLQGTHDVDIMLRVSDGLPLMMRDNVDETYTWADGSTVRFRGFTLSFGEGVLPPDQPSMAASLRDVLDGGSGGNSGGSAVPPAGRGRVVPPDAGPGGSPPGADRAGNGPGSSAASPGMGGSGAGGNDIEVNATSGGVKLTVKNLRFAPDSAELLPEERGRLDLLARALQATGGKTFLVEGHTASIGRPSNEMTLSIERAKHIVNEMVNRGIPADRFIYKGWGGTRPAGDNSSEAGRGLNRRVEITILE
jgi:outer membrane protein OmpA-like peptidoglycan-associated protein